MERCAGVRLNSFSQEVVGELGKDNTVWICNKLLNLFLHFWLFLPLLDGKFHVWPVIQVEVTLFSQFTRLRLWSIVDSSCGSFRTETTESAPRCGIQNVRCHLWLNDYNETVYSFFTIEITVLYHTRQADNFDPTMNFWLVLGLFCRYPYLPVNCRLSWIVK